MAQWVDSTPGQPKKVLSLTVRKGQTLPEQPPTCSKRTVHSGRSLPGLPPPPEPQQAVPRYQPAAQDGAAGWDGKRVDTGSGRQSEQIRVGSALLPTLTLNAFVPCTAQHKYGYHASVQCAVQHKYGYQAGEKNSRIYGAPSRRLADGTLAPQSRCAHTLQRGSRTLSVRISSPTMPHLWYSSACMSMSRYVSSATVLRTAW